MPSLTGRILSRLVPFTLTEHGVVSVEKRTRPRLGTTEYLVGGKLCSTPVFEVNDQDEVLCLTQGVEFTLQGDILILKNGKQPIRAELNIGASQLQVYILPPAPAPLAPMKIPNDVADKPRFAFSS